MSVVDKFDIDDCIEEPVLSYIAGMAMSHFPDVDFDENGNPMLYQSFETLYTFVRRYNNRKIEYKFEYEDYFNSDNGKEIQKVLFALNIDSEKFWYLLLFVYDFTYCTCITGKLIGKSPKEHLKSFIKGIEDNIDDFDRFTFKNKTEITLTVKGNHSVVIDNPVAIYYLLFMCKDGLSNVVDGSIMTRSKVYIDQEKEAIVSLHMCLFTKMIMSCLNENIQGNQRKQRKGDVVSFNKLALISRLIHFTRILINKKLLDGDDVLKQCLKKYKKTEIKRMNLDYFNTFN